MVYPAILVFGALGVSGFWLIYSLTSDVHELAVNVDLKMERNLAAMAQNMSELSADVAAMINTGFMSRDMGMMNRNIGRPMPFVNSFPPW